MSEPRPKRRPALSQSILDSLIFAVSTALATNPTPALQRAQAWLDGVHRHLIKKRQVREASRRRCAARAVKPPTDNP
jgi:hypothetical protein